MRSAMDAAGLGALMGAAGPRLRVLDLGGCTRLQLARLRDAHESHSSL